MPPEPNGVGTTWTMRMLEVCLVTLGSPQQLTGGYLYHLRMAERAGQFGADLTFVSVAEGGWARQVASGVRAADRGQLGAAQGHPRAVGGSGPAAAGCGHAAPGRAQRRRSHVRVTGGGSGRATRSHRPGRGPWTAPTGRGVPPVPGRRRVR